MAASGGGGGGFNYRNGTQRSSLKVDRPLPVNSNPKNSVKSKPLSSSAVVRRNSTGSIAASPKNDTGGSFLSYFIYLFILLLN